MKIVHFGGWLGNWSKLPAADLYICTGNMLPNYPVRFDVKNAARSRTDRAREIYLQAKAVRAFDAGPYLGNPTAPVVVCRGNKDFVSYAKLFKSQRVYEIGETEGSFYVCGVNIAGMRGTPVTSYTKRWVDEVLPGEWEAKAAKIPKKIDILVTHASRVLLPCLTDPGSAGEGIEARAHLSSWNTAFSHCQDGDVTVGCAAGGYMVWNWNGRRLYHMKSRKGLFLKN